MSIRLIVTMTAAPGKGAAFVQAFKQVCETVNREEAGCEQYEVFQGALDPDRWSCRTLGRSGGVRCAPEDARLAPFPDGLAGSLLNREDYVYSRTG